MTLKTVDYDKLAKSMLRRPDQRPLWEWAHDYIDLRAGYAVAGKFDIQTCLWLKEPMQALLDPSVRNVTSMSGVQCLKTLLGEMWVCWVMVEAPGPLQWLQRTNMEANQHAKERALELIHACDPLKNLMTGRRGDEQNNFIKFQNGGYIRMEGAEEKGNLQRKSIRYQMCSEAWQWEEGRLGEAAARLTQFSHNSKRYVEGQAGHAEDDMTLHYLKGTQEVLHTKCQKCREPMPLKWSIIREDGSRAGMVWEHKKDASGNVDIARAQETVRYECPKCGEPHIDDPLTRRRLMNDCFYISENPNASETHRSFRYNQLISPTIPWVEKIDQWLFARREFRKGNELPQIEFLQKVCAEPDDPMGRVAHLQTVSYTPGDGWQKELYRFLTVDVQQDCFWFVIRAWAEDGDSRLIDCGQETTWNDIESKADEHGVYWPNVGIDSGFATMTVYQQIVNRSRIINHPKLGKKVRVMWRAMKGNDRLDGFTHYVTLSNGAKQPVKKPFCTGEQKGDPNSGKIGQGRGLKAPLVNWSNPLIKDIFVNLRDGNGASWEAFDNVSDDWKQQMHSERREELRGGKYRYEQIGKRPNHLLDCECMNIVFACKAGIINTARDPSKTQPEASTSSTNHA